MIENIKMITISNLKYYFTFLYTLLYFFLKNLLIYTINSNNLFDNNPFNKDIHWHS